VNQMSKMIKMVPQAVSDYDHIGRYFDPQF
jgi:hypothetical protein